MFPVAAHLNAALTVVVSVALVMGMAPLSQDPCFSLFCKHNYKLNDL